MAIAGSTNGSEHPQILFHLELKSEAGKNMRFSKIYRTIVKNRKEV